MIDGFDKQVQTKITDVRLE